MPLTMRLKALIRKGVLLPEVTIAVFFVPEATTECLLRTVSRVLRLRLVFRLIFPLF